VSSGYLEAHPAVVRHLVEANVEAIELMESDPEGAKQIVREQLAEAGAPPLPARVVDRAWDKLTFTWDPLPATFVQGAQSAFALGYLEQEPDALTEIYRLEALNALLGQRGLVLVKVPL
jgi:NitT/TauT family transport system substrate-binding protein